MTTRLPSQALPPRLCLADHRSVLPRGARSRLLGLDPDRALLVDDLDPALALMLDELADPVDAVPLVARAVERGADTEDAAELLRALVDARVLVDARAARRRAGRRTSSTVVVTGDGPLAAGVVAGLVGAGVGTVHIDARGTVGAADLGTGLVDGDRGSERGAAVAGAARRLVPGAQVGAPPRRLVPDLVVFADAQVPAPAPLAHTARDGTPHLLVRLRDGIGVVGPLVLPGRTACLRCLDLRRTDLDPGWPGVAAQLVGRCGRADPATTAATAAFGAAQALAALDSTSAPATLDTTVELDLAAAMLRRRHWAPHPDCACGASAATGHDGVGGVRHPVATCRMSRGRGTMVS